MDEPLPHVSPQGSPIGNVLADGHHPPRVTYKEEIMNLYRVTMEHVMESSLSYEAAMAELHRLIQYQFRAYYNAEKARYGDHPPCSPPPPAPN